MSTNFTDPVGKANHTKGRYSPATLVIDLDHLRHNFRFFRNLIHERTRVMAMVKADAYGCGLVEIGRALQDLGVDYLGVAYVSEGRELRAHGIEIPVMVMNPLPQEFTEMVRDHLEPELSSLSLLKEWITYINSINLEGYPVHLEVDTGMKRLGFVEEEMKEVAGLLNSAGRMKVASVFSHLASSSAPEDDAFTREQFKQFGWWCNMFQGVLGYSPLRHMLNSGGIYRFPDHQYDMVRLGVGLYGAGMESLPIQMQLKPVQSLMASISQIKRVARSETVGYGRSGSLSAPGRIAVINLGYADGLPRLAGHGRFAVRIGQDLCPVVGAVCMDMIMVDVSGCPDVRLGDPVEIYGTRHPILHLARAGETISYEILTANHQRLRKVYKT